LAEKEEEKMSLYMMIGLIGLIYIVVFGGMALMKREGLSTRFAFEALIITGVAFILALLTPIQIHPVIFLLVLYVITMRVRILVDLANTFAGRGNTLQAEKIYNLAAHMWPDQTNSLIVKVNHAVLLLQKNQLDESIALFTDILSPANRSHIGVKYEAAAHYNLGVAYLRKDNPYLATVQFNAAIDAWPASLYAQRAQKALEKQRAKNAPHQDTTPPEG
jgi:tetratricopeptide (TPR) repeat protein